MAVPANLNHLNRIGLADVSLGAIHRFQAHLRAVAAVASNTAETFRGMDVRFVRLRWLGQIVHAKCRMADCAGLSLRLSIQNSGIGYKGHANEQSGQPQEVAPTERRT